MAAFVCAGRSPLLPGCPPLLVLLQWPMMMSSRDRPAFVEKVYEAKQRHLKAMVAAGEVPLRKGAAAVGQAWGAGGLGWGQWVQRWPGRLEGGLLCTDRRRVSGRACAFL